MAETETGCVPWSLSLSLVLLTLSISQKLGGGVSDGQGMPRNVAPSICLIRFHTGLYFRGLNRLDNITLLQLLVWVGIAQNDH